MELLLPILFGCLILNTLLGLFQTRKTLMILRTYHEPKWITMGRPSLLAGNSPGSMTAFLIFIWRGGYDAVSDSDLKVNCYRLRLFHVFQLMFLIGAILAAALTPAA